MNVARPTNGNESERKGARRGESRRPTRTCVGCGLRDDAAELLRLVAVEDEFAFDLAGGAFGRGAHLHARAACIDKAPAGSRADFAERVRTEDRRGRSAGRLVEACDRRMAGLLLAAHRSRARSRSGPTRRIEALERGAPLGVVAVDAGGVAADGRGAAMRGGGTSHRVAHEKRARELARRAIRRNLRGSSRRHRRRAKEDARCRGCGRGGDDISDERRCGMQQISGGSMSGKVRVYEVAKQLNLDPKQVVGLFQAIGVVDVRNHMSSVEPEAVERDQAPPREAAHARRRRGARPPGRPGRQAARDREGLVRGVVARRALDAPSLPHAAAPAPQVLALDDVIAAAASAAREWPCRRPSLPRAAACLRPRSERARARSSRRRSFRRPSPSPKPSSPPAPSRRGPSASRTTRSPLPPPRRWRSRSPSPRLMWSSLRRRLRLRPRLRRRSWSRRPPPPPSPPPPAPDARSAGGGRAAVTPPKTGVEYWTRSSRRADAGAERRPRAASTTQPNMPRRVQYDPRAGTMGGPSARRDVRAPGQQPGRPMMGRGTGGAGRRPMGPDRPQEARDGLHAGDERAQEGHPDRERRDAPDDGPADEPQGHRASDEAPVDGHEQHPHQHDPRRRHGEDPRRRVRLGGRGRQQERGADRSPRRAARRRLPRRPSSRTCGRRSSR